MDTYQAYRIFVDVWRLYRKYSPPSSPDDGAYWRQLVQEAEKLIKTYKSRKLCMELLGVVIDELDSQARKGGCNDG